MFRKVIARAVTLDDIPMLVAATEDAGLQIAELVCGSRGEAVTPAGGHSRRT